MEVYRYTGIQVTGTYVYKCTGVYDTAVVELLPACELSPWLQRWMWMVVAVRLEHRCNVECGW